MSQEKLSTKRAWNRWSEEDDIKLRSFAANANDRHWIATAAAEMGKTEFAVSGRARILGVKKASNVRHDYFENWSQRMAYSLGYIWSDGSVESEAGRLRLRCSPKDDYVIMSIAEEIGGYRVNKPVPPSAIEFPANKSGVIMSNGLTSISINSRRMIESLFNSHGVCQNKSNVNPEYREIPAEFLGSFFRGVLDGDGCVVHINKRSAGFCIYGSDLFLDGLSRQSGEVFGIKSPKVSKNRNLGRISWCAQSDSVKIFREIYKNAESGFFLERKKQKWMQYASQSQIETIKETER